jgi:hypothetical protein
MVEVLKTGKWNPQQAILEAQGAQSDMQYCAVVWVNEGEDQPRVCFSEMKPSDMNFLGFALQHYAIKHMD